VARRVLLLTFHFPPSAASGSFRLLSFAQHLPAHGWETLVVAPPSMPWEPVDLSLNARIPPQTAVRRVPYPGRLPKVVRWLAPWAVWLPFAHAAVRKVVRAHRPDAILSSGPPHWVHLLGRSAGRKHRLPWIADFRDPWITSAFHLRLSSWQKRWQRRWEDRVLRDADLVLGNAPRACEALKLAYPRAADRIECLTNGFDPESFPRDIERVRPPGPLRVLHAGELYVGRDPRPLLDAIAAIGAETSLDFRVEFLGRVEYAAGADLARDARRRGVEHRVICRGQVGYEQILREMCDADVLLLMDTPGRRIGVPAKLFEYFGAGRPILALGEADGDLATILAQSGTPHRIVRPDSAAAIRAALIDLPRLAATTPRPSSNLDGRLRFSRRRLAGQLADLLARAAREHGEQRR